MDTVTAEMFWALSIKTVITAGLEDRHTITAELFWTLSIETVVTVGLEDRLKFGRS